MKIHDIAPSAMVERECCQSQDLKPVEHALPKDGLRLMFCIHCGHRHHVATADRKPDALRAPERRTPGHSPSCSSLFVSVCGDSQRCDCDADARFIAAAPTMYAMYAAIQFCLDEDNDWMHCREELRRAIAEAEGR